MVWDSSAQRSNPSSMVAGPSLSVDDSEMTVSKNILNRYICKQILTLEKSWISA